MIEYNMQFGHEQLAVYPVSIQDLAWAYQVAKRMNACLTAAQDTQGKTMLIRIGSMLTTLGRRHHEMRETAAFYGDNDNDDDNDNDNDNDNES